VAFRIIFRVTGAQLRVFDVSVVVGADRHEPFQKGQGTSEVVCWIQHNVILTQRRENNWCNYNSHFQMGHHDRDKVYVQLIGSEARYELSSSLGWNHARSSSKGQTIASNPKPSHRIRCTSQHSSNRNSNWPISRGLNGFM
jgi:hypothetical protein